MKLIFISLFAFLLFACATVPQHSAAKLPEKNTDDLTPLHIAAGHGDVIEMEKLITAGADAQALDSKMGVSVLHKAVYSGNPLAVKFLIDHGAGAIINLQSPSNGDTPLHDAIYFKKTLHGEEMIALLLKSGASLSIRNRAGLTPLESAKLLKDDSTVGLIKKEMSRRFTPNGTKLMQAVKKKNVALVKRLLADPVSQIEEPDEQGFTPLLWAAREGMVQITSLLLKQGCDPNKLDAWMGANAGHKAAFWGRTEIMKLLLAYHLDLNARGLYNGYTPLHDAVSGNHLDMAKLLVDAGAKLDIQGHDGKTPLDIARENGNPEMIKLCLPQVIQGGESAPKPRP